MLGGGVLGQQEGRGQKIIKNKEGHKSRQEESSERGIKLMQLWAKDTDSDSGSDTDSDPKTLNPQGTNNEARRTSRWPDFFRSRRAL